MNAESPDSSGAETSGEVCSTVRTPALFGAGELVCRWNKGIRLGVKRKQFSTEGIRFDVCDSKSFS